MLSLRPIEDSKLKEMSRPDSLFVITNTSQVIDLRIDLHSHTHYSDGKLSVKELLLRALQMQVDVLAITDHDTVAAIEPALNLLQNDVAFSKAKLKLISGCEISTWWHGFEIHILGLNVNHQCSDFIDRLNTQLARREQRAQKISDKLAKLGHSAIFEDANKLLAQKSEGHACISRMHIARVLVNRGICNNFEQAFRQYLGKNKKAYVKPNWIDIQTAVKWIHDAGGKAVIAHPFRYDMTTKWLRRLVKEFQLAGGDGLEVQHPNLDLKRHKLMLEIATDNNLAVSAGSDFHAPGKWTELGRRLSLPESHTPIWQMF